MYSSKVILFAMFLVAVGCNTLKNNRESIEINKVLIYSLPSYSLSKLRINCGDLQTFKDVQKDTIIGKSDIPRF